MEAMERELSAQEYNWTTLLQGYVNTGTWPSRFGDGTQEWRMRCEIREVETGPNLAEPSKEGSDSRNTVVP